jgi:hypothetical protein
VAPGKESADVKCGKARAWGGRQKGAAIVRGEGPEMEGARTIESTHI